MYSDMFHVVILPPFFFSAVVFQGPPGPPGPPGPKVSSV